MPAVSDKQLRFMRAEYGRKKKGLKTKTGMSLKRLKKFSTMPKGRFHE